MVTTILCIETATTNCSVAIVRNAKILAVKEDYDKQYSHAEKLHVFIREILNENQLDFCDLNAVAISKGPGSYTGLRIGVSAAKGLCFSLDIPLISISTLTSLAHQVEKKNAVIIPMLDARRMEVYSAVYNSEYDQIRDTRAEILEASSFDTYLNKGLVCFIGSGVKKFKEICNNSNAVFIEDKLPSAKEMCQLTMFKYRISDTENVAYFEPYYLKDFIAG